MNGQIMVLKQGMTFKRVMPTIQIAEIPHEIERSFMRRVVQIDGFNLVPTSNPDVMRVRLQELFEYLSGNTAEDA